MLAGCNPHSLKSVQYDSESICSESVVIAVSKPEVVLVVDRSGSMSANPLGDGTRWAALHGVISEVVAGQDANTQFGLAMFPATDAGATWLEGACNVSSEMDVAVGPDNALAILSTLPPADAMMLGGTPAAAALELAAAHLRARSSDEPKLMVLITDGEANCAVGAGALDSLAYDEGLQDAVANAQLDGITTYVVGIQISDEISPTSGVVPSEMLDEVAQLGGAPLIGEHAFYSVDDQATLAEALSSITVNIGCTIALGSDVDTTREALVSVAGDYVDQIVDCESEDGWAYGGEDGASLLLCGQACADFQASGDVQLEYLCA
jgi:hypothetical protein